MKKKAAGIGSLAAITLTAGLFGIYLEPEPVSHLRELQEVGLHFGQLFQQGNGTCGGPGPAGVFGEGERDVGTMGYGYSGYYGPEIEIECEECDWIKEITMFWITDHIDDRMFLATINYLIKIDMISTPPESDPIAVSVPMSFKKVAVKWFEAEISTADYFETIQRLVDAEAIRIVDASDVKRPIPDWIRNTAEAWASDSIDIEDEEYLITVNFLIIESMIRVPDPFEPLVSDIPLDVKKVAKSWTDGEITDLQYIRQLERLIDREIIS